MAVQNVSVNRLSLFALLAVFAFVVGFATCLVVIASAPPAPEYQSKYKVADDALREFHRIRHLRGKE